MKTIKVNDELKVKKQRPEQKKGDVYVVEIGYSHDKVIADALFKMAKDAGFEPTITVRHYANQ